MWDAATGKQTALLSGLESTVWSARFSPDGRSIVTASADGTAMISRVEIADLMALAQSRVTRALICQERVTYLNEPLDCSRVQP